MATNSKVVQSSNRKEKPQVYENGRRLSLAPTGLAQYLGLDSCDRFLRFYLYKGETDLMARKLRDRGLQKALQPFGPLMSELGDRIETQVIDSLRASGFNVLNLADTSVEETLEAIQKATSQPIYLYQAQVEGFLGEWRFAGNADLIRISRNADNQLNILVADVKASRKDKVSHRLQVATYVRLLQDMLQRANLSPAKFEGAVVRRNNDGTLQNPGEALLFDLEPYFDALNQLAANKNSALAKVDKTPLENLHYYINQKCDGCLFNPICMVESTERQDIALIPFVESADKRALVEGGVKTVGQLAALKTLPVRSDESDSVSNRQLKTAPEKMATVATLSEKWPVGPKLDRLVQRAARVYKRLNPDENTTAYSYFFDSNVSTLPDDERYPELIKVFLDVQTDYLEERVYLVGARIVGPNNSQSVVKMSPSVPNEASERQLLVEWVSEIFAAVFALSPDPTATLLHLYLYNRHDQKALLDALRRHLDVFNAIPVLYSLLTETPALTQSAVSFLYDEVKERLNLPSTGHTLQAVATQTGFKWNDGDNRRYFRLFYNGMFDYLWRWEDGHWIEAAARFYSTIPLEYAYAVWGVLKPEDFIASKRHDIVPYTQVTLTDIEAFQGKRLEALAHIERNFRFKNRFIRKEPLNLLEVAANAVQETPFRKVLEDFLFIEHFANLQEHLQLFSQPITRRVQMGRALLLRCTDIKQVTSYNRVVNVAFFEADFSDTGLEPTVALQLNKIKEGDFIVLNRLENDGRAWEMVRGRLGVVQTLQGANISIELSDMTFGKKEGQTSNQLPFRYSHDNKLIPEIGEYYIIDDMVDDLNADRFLDGCRHADSNPFYHLLALPPEHIAAQNQRQPSVEVAVLKAKAAEFGQLVAELEGKNAPTLRQQAVISDYLTERILLVQGPPGTGKSHTLGWAVLARMLAERAANGGSLRVAISCNTHNAVNIVLQSIASKWAKLKGSEAFPYLENLQIFKTGREDSGDTSDELGILPLDSYNDRFKLRQIFNSSIVVIGGTPGGLHKLMQQRNRNNKTPDALWNDKPFDLVILDEASQMNLPMAILASSWLQENGQLIVVGDHRQMAPILVHSWDEEDRLDMMQSYPYRSVFQYLVDQTFPKIALDESFRLHRVQAAFLHENIYRHDGILFHSKQEKLLPSVNYAEYSPYLQAVMHPDYPIVVIKHAEQNSQQANPTEAELIAPIVRLCIEDLGLDGQAGLGVVVPHRAQRALLRERFPQLATDEAIDTVERFQGGEREVIIVSATASDPEYVLAEAEFLLNPNRLNVALSRPKKKLIVVASTAVFNFLSAQLEIFEQAALWKRLLAECAQTELWQGEYADTQVQVLGCQA